MKTSFLKLFIPVLLFSVAIVGAFATNSSDKAASSASHVQGFVKLNPLGTVCDTPEMCSIQFGPICTVGSDSNGDQLWGKDLIDRCVVELYRIQ